MTTALAVILTIVLTGPAFWCWGHSTARVRHIPAATFNQPRRTAGEGDRG